MLRHLLVYPRTGAWRCKKGLNKIIMLSDWRLDEGHLGVHFQDMALRTSVKSNRQSLHGHFPDMELRLECDEVVEDWDDIDGFDNERLPFTMYDDNPPNSPVSCNAENEKVDMCTTNKYVSSLLQIWRDSGEASDQSAESTQVNWSPGSDCFSLHTDSTSPASDIASQYSSCASDQDDDLDLEHEEVEEDIVATMTAEMSMQEQSSRSEEQSERTLQQEQQEVDTSNSSSSYPSLPGPAQDQVRRSPSPFQDTFGDGIIEGLRNLRSLSPLHEESRTSSRSSSPSLEEIHSDMADLQNRSLHTSSPAQAMLDEQAAADLPFEDYMYHVFPEQRFSSRTRANLSSGDYEVPDIDTEMYSDHSDSEGFPAFSRRQNSCTDQVVPSSIEE